MVDERRPLRQSLEVDDFITATYQHPGGPLFSWELTDDAGYARQVWLGAGGKRIVRLEDQDIVHRIVCLAELATQHDAEEKMKQIACAEVPALLAISPPFILKCMYDATYEAHGEATARWLTKQLDRAEVRDAWRKNFRATNPPLTALYSLLPHDLPSELPHEMREKTRQPAYELQLQ